MKKLTWVLPLVLALGLAGCGQKQSSDNDSSSSAVKTSKTSSSSTTTSSAKVDVKVTFDQAWQTFTDKHADAAVTNVELDKGMSGYEYKIEGTSNDQEYELVLDAQTGKTVREHQEKLDADEANGVQKREDGIKKTGLKNIDDVTKIAEKQAKGTASQWDLSKDDGSTTWEVKVQQGHQSTEVTIDAYSGAVVNTEQDD